MLTTISLVILAALLGAAFCFAGYRFFLVLLPIWGFFAGFWLGAMGTSLLLGSGFLATTTGLVVGFVVGIIAAVLSYLFYLVGVLIIAAAFGGALASGVMSAVGLGPGLMTTIVIIVSVLVAAGLTLLLNLQKYVIIIFTSMAGAVLFVMAGMLLFGQITVLDLQSGASVVGPIFKGYWTWAIAWLVLTVAGVVVQLRTAKAYAFTKEDYVEGWG